MARQTKQRFIVTYAEEEVDYGYAANVLGVETKSVYDGLALLSTEKPEAEEEILHFESLGTSVMSLSKQQVKDLEGDNRVAEVVPDFEVFAHGGPGSVPGASYQDWGEEEAGPRDDGGAGAPSDVNSYMAGYYQALADMYRGGPAPGAPAAPLPSGATAGSESSFFPFPFPFPFPPSWFPCPPGYRRVGWRCVPILQPPAQPIPWNITMVKADQVWSRVTGQGVKVAIIDTGIDNDHPDLSVAGGVSFVPGVLSWAAVRLHSHHVPAPPVRFGLPLRNSPFTVTLNPASVTVFTV